TEVTDDPVEQRLLAADPAGWRKRRCRQIKARKDTACLVDAVQAANPLRRFFDVLLGAPLDRGLGRHAPGVVSLVVDDDQAVRVRHLFQDTTSKRLVAL